MYTFIRFTFNESFPQLSAVALQKVESFEIKIDCSVVVLAPVHQYSSLLVLVGELNLAVYDLDFNNQMSM